ncbi:MAG: glycosyltransferase family 39 protein, partial [Candidatus Levybacteria bacterium]|nr:glycosyltransferase family 39 protein [Candidatus Levybacteria bacterium]
MTKKKILAIKNKYRNSIYLFFIILFAFYLRTFNLNWDNNYYFHPDERAIIMYAAPLKFPVSLDEFLSISSPLNPHFFAYGNFPLYLLKGLGTLLSPLDTTFSEYGGMHIVGRLISATADTVTVAIIFILGSVLFSRRAGLFASLLYALSVFPIQTSHFFAVDTLLTFFMTTTILLLISFIKSPSKKTALAIGILLGFCLATKVSALILLPYVFMSFLIAFFILRKKTKIYSLIFLILILILSCLSVFFITQPYVAIDFSNFFQQTSQQSKMGSDPFVFPYTLQYVGKISYIYELKNIFLYGQGPITSSICLFGLVIALHSFFKKWKKHVLVLFLASYGVGYFLLFGNFAVGWMRYMLPIYPVLVLFGGYLLSQITDLISPKFAKNYLARKSLLLLLLIFLILYPISFLSIYLYPSTRIQASEWINNNIPPGSTIAVEHWDDALPVNEGQKYTHLSLPLYDPDTTSKWNQIDAMLNV